MKVIKQCTTQSLTALLLHGLMATDHQFSQYIYIDGLLGNRNVVTGSVTTQDYCYMMIYLLG